jgi:hypothetical protein
MTADGKAFRSSAWNVAKDAPIPLKKPPYFQRTNDGRPSCSVVGNVIIADWANCAGPCHHARIVTSSGVEVGTLSPGYPAAIQVSDKAFALATYGGDMTPNAFRLYDLKSGAPYADIPVALVGIGEPRMVRLTGDAFAAVTFDAETRTTRISVVSVASPSKPSLVGEMTLPECR